jgi:hypothetical protein
MTTTDKVNHAIIINQIALNNNEAIKHTQYYKRSLKAKLNTLLQELYSCEKDYDAFFNSEENSTCDVYDVYERYTKAISSIPIYECENIILIIEAYKKDPKSIEGICKKILK